MTSNSFVKKYYWDLVLFLVGTSFLGLFTWNSRGLLQNAQLSKPMAKLQSGMISVRKESGGAFAQASVGSEFYPLQVLFTAEGQEATLLLEDQSVLKLKEFTLLVLKRPFRPHSGRLAIEEQIDVISGKVTVEREKEVSFKAPMQKILPDQKEQETQAPATSVRPSNQGHLYPGDQTLILSMSKKSEIFVAFFVPQADAERILTIRAISNTSECLLARESWPLDEKGSVSIPLKVGKSTRPGQPGCQYQWGASKSEPAHRLEVKQALSQGISIELAEALKKGQHPEIRTE